MKLSVKVLLLIAALSLPLFAQTIQTMYTSGFRNSVVTNTGTWDLELWADSRGTGGISCTLYNNGSFRGRWTTGYNTLLRTGKKFPNNTTISNLSSVSLRYDVSNFGSDRGATYMTVYGWTRNPMIEYYIIDDWQHWNPGQAGRGTSPNFYTHHGTVVSDGGTYDIISARRVDQPSIDGNQTFLQIFNIRQTRRSSGTINISEHFKAWESAITNVSLGGTSSITWGRSANLYEISFCLEGYGGDSRNSGGGRINNLCINWGSDKLCTWGGCTNCGGGTTPGNYTLTTNVTPPAVGEITRSSNPAGGYAPGTQVTLTRPNSSDWVFSGWSGGGCTGTGATCVVTMNANTTVTATYTLSPDANLIRDGNFTGGTGTSLGSAWALGTGGTSNATASVSSGATRAVTVNITAVTANEWEPQLTQQNIALVQGTSYTLTFTASAVAARTVNVMLQEVGGDYTPYTSREIELTTAPQQFTHTFTMASASDPAAQFAFNFGGSAANATANVTISNVVLRQSSSASISPKNTVASASKNSELRATARPGSAVNVSFRAAGSGETVVKLYGLKGDVISTARIQTVAGMDYSHSFGAGKLPAGFYIVGLRSGGRTEQARVVVSK